MEITLEAHIRQTTPLPTSVSTFAPYFEVMDVPKRDHLGLSGRVKGTLVFVERGLMRLYSTDARARERTLQFGVEGCWVGAGEGSEIGESMARWQAIEDSRVVVIRPEAHERLLMVHPEMARYFLRVFRRGEVAARRRNHLLAHWEGAERYDQFQRHHRSFVQRVPQYMLASFLGFSPEWLSKIRAKKQRRP